MKRMIKVSAVLVSILAVVFLLAFIILYSGIFPILTGFNINSVINTIDTSFTISFDKVRASKYYIVEIHDSKDELLYKKKIDKNEFTQDFGFIQENETYKLDVYAYNKKDESRKANNTYEFNYQKEVYLTKDSNNFLNNETTYIYLSRLVDTKNYSIKLTKNKYDDNNTLIENKLIKEDIITSDVYEINESYFKDEKVELVVELLKNETLIDTVKLYNNMYPQETPEVISPENGSTVELNEIYLKFKDLTWAERYEIQIVNSSGNVIATTGTEENEVLIDKSIFKDGMYTINVNAYLGEYSTKASTMFKVESVVSPVYVSKDINHLTKGEKIELYSTNEGTIYYTIDGTDPLNGGLVYSSPITINENTTLKTVVINKDIHSDVKTYELKINKKDISVYLASSNQYYNIGVTPYTNERKEMNLVSDLIEKKLTSKNIKVYRNDYLSSYSNILSECEYNNIDLLVSLETTSSDSHDKSGIQTIITNSSSNSYSLSNIINSNLNKLKESKLMYSNNIKGSNTIEKGNMLSLMVELGYHDNETDAKFIINNREKIAESIADSILSYYGIN